MRTLRKRLTCLLLALVLPPMLITSIWYYRLAKQQRLDHAFIEAIKKEDTQKAIELLNQGADANVTAKPDTPITMTRFIGELWERIKGSPLPSSQSYAPSAFLLYFQCDR